MLIKLKFQIRYLDEIAWVKYSGRETGVKWYTWDLTT